MGGNRLLEARAYVAGFALTVSPGKVGELLRIRYFAPLGVPAARVVAAFLYERSLDLLVVGAGSLALLLAFPSLGLLALGFMALVLTTVALLWGFLRHRSTRPLQTLLPRRWRRLLWSARRSADDLSIWLQPRTLLIGLGIGALAWGLVACGFAWALWQLDAWPGALVAWGTYPAAMLAGAASAVPGGVASTEAAVVMILSSSGLDWQTALIAALLARAVSLWGAVLLGVSVCLRLEWAPATHEGV